MVAISQSPTVPVDEYGEHYFKRYNYADRPLDKFSMYWFARRYYAALVRHFGPTSGELLEMGCGLGHLLGLLEDQYETTGIDLADYCIEQTRQNAPHTRSFVQSADDLSVFGKEQFNVVVALHLVEHLPDPIHSIEQVNHILKPGGLFLYATPNPIYSLRRFKDHQTDAIGKDVTHINVQEPRTWRKWTEMNGFKVLRHFGDGLWDVPYVPVLPKAMQFALFGIPALMQVVTQTTYIPLTYGVNQVVIARKMA